MYAATVRKNYTTHLGTHIPLSVGYYQIYYKYFSHYYPMNVFRLAVDDDKSLL